MVTLALNAQRSAGNYAVARTLAHATPSGRTVARRLKVQSDDQRNAMRFCQLVMPAIGKQLVIPNVRQLAALKDGGTLDTPPTSPSMADQVTGVMNDSEDDAKLLLGVNQTGVLIGEAALGYEPMTTAVDMDDIDALEADQPGFGVAALAHEITESYAANQILNDDAKGSLGSAHEAGEAAGSQVISELIAPGERIADRHTKPNDRGVSRSAFDYGNYYMVFDVTARRTEEGEKLTISNPEISGRDDVPPQFVVQGFFPGSDVLPAAATGTIAGVLAVLDAHPMATAVIEGYTDSTGTPEINDALSERRATNVRDRFGRLEEALHSVGRGMTEPVGDNGSDDGRAQNRRVVITITEPDIA
jgi:outer membrane protein OmpA-like peptidoglycan-associated protein